MLKHTNIIAAIVLASVTAAVLAEDPAPRFTIKDHEARTGSKFRREVVRSGSVPLNLPYDKLTQEQKAVLKAPYESMGPDDEPPFPEAGLMAIVTEMGEAQKVLRVRGNLRLHAKVDSSGKVTSVAVMESVERRMDVYVAGILMRTKFKPAKCAGVPCNQEYQFSWSLEVN